MESSAMNMSPLLLRNLITSIFLFADKSLINLAERSKLLELIRYVLITSFLFFLRLLPSLVPPLYPSTSPNSHQTLKPTKLDPNYPPPSSIPDCGIARGLSQLLSILNTIPVSSRKYEAVRGLAERIIDENQLEGTDALKEVNRKVLSGAFSSTMNQLEVVMMDRERERGRTGGIDGNGDSSVGGPAEYGMNRVFRAVWAIGDVLTWKTLGRAGEDGVRIGGSAEKLAAELVWLAKKLAGCGCADEAVCMWASASNLAWLAVAAEPRLQGSLVKVSAFLFKQAKDMGLDETDESKEVQQRQTKMKLLMSWLPLLCRASNGTDVPVLSASERAELEKVLEGIIDMLEQEEEQEQVLSQWLHHFMYCSSSDWPNLHASYTRWCTASRKLLHE